MEIQLSWLHWASLHREVNRLKNVQKPLFRRENLQKSIKPVVNYKEKNKRRERVLS